MNLNGLTKYLTEDLDFDDLLRATPIPTLFLINSGPIPPNPLELLGSEKMMQLIDQLKQSFDYILVDSPPLLAVSDALVVGALADGAVLVVRGGQTPREAMQLAGEKGYQLWKAYMRTWADLELDHIQFNVVDDATLRAAQKDPEKYQEVIVRVAGYSAHFVDISRKTQDNIIQRTVQGLG